MAIIETVEREVEARPFSGSELILSLDLVETTPSCLLLVISTPVFHNLRV